MENAMVFRTRFLSRHADGMEMSLPVEKESKSCS